MDECMHAKRYLSVTSSEQCYTDREDFHTVHICIATLYLISQLNAQVQSIICIMY
jgi:hypothetical protein